MAKNVKCKVKKISNSVEVLEAMMELKASGKGIDAFNSGWLGRVPYELGNGGGVEPEDIPEGVDPDEVDNALGEYAQAVEDLFTAFARVAKLYGAEGWVVKEYGDR